MYSFIYRYIILIHIILYNLLYNLSSSKENKSKSASKKHSNSKEKENNIVIDNDNDSNIIIIDDNSSNIDNLIDKNNENKPNNIINKPNSDKDNKNHKNNGSDHKDVNKKENDGNSKEKKNDAKIIKVTRIDTQDIQEKFDVFIDKLNKSNQNIINLLLQFATFFIVENISIDGGQVCIKRNWLNWEWPEEMSRCIYSIWKILEKHGAGSSLFKIYFNEEYQNDYHRLWIQELFISISELFFDTFIVNNKKNDNMLIGTLNPIDLDSPEFRLFMKWWSILNEYVYFNSTFDKTIYVRFIWLKYQYEYLIGNVDEAKYNLNLLLKENFQEINYRNSKYIKKLSPSIVKLHICMISASEYINETKNMFSMKMYQEIISHLRNLFDTFFDSDSKSISEQFHHNMEHWGSNDNDIIQLTPENELYHSILLEYINKCTINARLDLLDLLINSYQKLNQTENIFICLIYVLIDITRNVSHFESNVIILKYHHYFSSVVKSISASPRTFLEQLNKYSDKLFYLFVSVVFLYTRISLFLFENSQELYQHLKILLKEDNTIEKKFNTFLLDVWILFVYIINYLKDEKIISENENKMKVELAIQDQFNDNTKDPSNETVDPNTTEGKDINIFDEPLPMVIDVEGDGHDIKMDNSNNTNNNANDKAADNNNDDLIIIEDKEKSNSSGHGSNNSNRKNSVSGNGSHNKKNSGSKREEDDYGDLSFEDKVNDTITDLLIYIHKELGYLHICNCSEGRFLNLCIDHLKKLNRENDDYSYSIYLCYYCLYHIDGLYEVDDHETEELELDNETILSYTKFLGNDVIQNFSSLTNKQRQLALETFDYLNDTLEKNEPGLGKYIYKKKNIIYAYIFIYLYIYIFIYLYIYIFKYLYIYIFICLYIIIILNKLFYLSFICYEFLFL